MKTLEIAAAICFGLALGLLPWALALLLSGLLQ